MTPGHVQVFAIEPTPKPRQTRADRWIKRPPVLRYRAFADEVRLRHLELPTRYYHVVFVMTMPSSWPEKKKRLHEGCPHTDTPDKDNLEKALLDAVYGRDEHVWDGRVSKVWGRMGLIIVSASSLDLNPPIYLDPIYAAAASSRAQSWRSEVPWASTRRSGFRSAS